MSTVPNRQDTVNYAEPAEDHLEGAPRAPRTSAGDAFSEFAVLLIRLHGQLSAAGDGLSRPAGQSSARWQVLAGAEDGSRTVADVARTLGLARQSVQRVADLLDGEGLVAYADNPRHRRARLIVLTAPGREVLSTIQAGQRTWADRLGAEIGERRLRETCAVLERAVRALEVNAARTAGP